MQSKRIMWAASALVLLAGCQKTPQSGQIVRFTAVSQPAVLTKVQYTGELAGGKERIDWKEGDAIRIYSSGAKASNDPSYTWADYAVTAVGPASGAVSQAEISVTSAQGGLAWGSGTNTFYAVYPSPGGSADVPVRGTSVTPFNGTIPTAQNGTAISVKDLSDQSANIDVYYPNASAYHLAYNSLEEPVADTPLAFDPAYTAFHISAGHNGTDPVITVKSVTLKAASGNAVAGDFTAYRSGSAWTFGCPDYASGSNDAVTFNFAAGSYPVLNSSTSKLELVLYALPQDLTNLTLDFVVDVAGVGTNLHRTLELKIAAAKDYNGHHYDAGDWLIFNACKKAYIKGLLIPGASWTIDTGTTIQVKTTAVKDWTEVKPGITYDTDPVINASGLDELDHGAHLYEFFIYSPTGATWQVKVLNSSKALAEGVTITREERPDTSSDPASGSGVLTGTVGGGKADAPGRVRFKLSLISGSSGPYTLSFSVKISVGGTVYEYPINTEVIRGDGSGNGFESGNYAPINFS